MTDEEKFQRYRITFKHISIFLQKIKQNNIVLIDKVKLRQAIEKYSEDTKEIKECFKLGKTNESKQCVLTIKALNLYKPLYLESIQNINNVNVLNYINEIVALYCGFIYFKKEIFKRKFMNDEGWIYLLNSNSIDYEQLMITLNIFYKDYN